MILLAAGEIKSLKWNVKHFYDQINRLKDINLYNEKQTNIGSQGGQNSLKWTNAETFQFVNLSLIYVKCLLLEGGNEQTVQEILLQCRRVLKDGLMVDPKDLKQRMQSIVQDKLDNQNVQKDDEKSSAYTKNNPKSYRGKKHLEFNEFKWMLSAYALVASFYCAVGNQQECQQVYAKYVKFVEEFFEKDSLEVGNAYFQLGIYFFE